MPTLDTYKLENDSIQSLEEKLDLVDKACQKTGAELDTQFKSAVEALDNAKLAGLLDKQFKEGDAYKSVDAMQSDDSYTFLVQASLDAISQDGRYENLLRGKDAKFGIDDKYGSRTRAAVSQFQRDTGIKEDGIVWPETMAKLVGVLNGTVKIDLTKTIVDGVEVYDGKTAETPAKDLSQKTAEGILTIDAYGNKVNYVDSKDKIPSDKFNKPEFGANVYVYKWFRVYGNGRVMNLTTKEMFNWADLDAKVAANGNKPVDKTVASIDSNAINYSKEKINKDIYNVTFTEIQSLFSSKSLAESNTAIAAGNNEVAAFLKTNTLKFYNTSNPNIVINYGYKNWVTLTLPSINIHSILKNDVLNKTAIYSQLNKSIVDQIAKNKEAEKKAKILKNNNEAVVKIRGMKWTLEQLFPDKAKDHNKAYEAYFSRFEGKNVTVDSDAQYTYLSSKNKLVFDLDEEGYYDASYSKNKSIDMALITDADGKLDTAKFTAEIKKIVTTSVEAMKKDA